MEKYRSDIDGIRGLAILSVLLFHFFPNRFPLGYLGVDSFFVISGFLITKNISILQEAGKFRLITFYKNRVLRLLPSLLFLLTICWLFARISLFSYRQNMLNKHIWGATTFTSNLIYAAENGYFETTSQLKPLLHLWSLSIEEQFYLAYPILLICLRRTKYITALAIILMTVSASLFLLTRGTTGTENFFQLSTRAWELAAGCIVATLSSTKISLFFRNTIANTSFTFLIAICFFPNDFSAGMTSCLHFVVVLFSGLLIYSNAQNSASFRLLKFKPAVSLGLISYATYLIHFPINSFAHLMGLAPFSTWKNLFLLFISIAMGKL